jgi:hypothetical protein
VVREVVSGIQDESLLQHKGRSIPAVNHSANFRL